MAVDENDLITEFAEKPREPKSNLASMGIYIFTWSKLRAYLIADEADPASENDFGKNVIPAMLAAGEKMAAYRFEGYWKDVGTLDSLWDANMDMLAPGLGAESARPALADLQPHTLLPARVRRAGRRRRQQRHRQGLRRARRSEKQRPEL